MAKSHPTYNSDYKKWGRKVGKIQDRMKLMNFIDPWSEEGIKQSEEFAKKHGRAWWYFQSVKLRHNREPTWIEQYRVEDPNRPRGEGIRKKVGRPRKDV